jgi:lipopolysaccharide transport system permease protein
VEHARTVVITPETNRRIIDWRELIEYRDLFYFMVLREIKVLYAQTVLGLTWAILQPVIQVLIFTIVFGKVANIPTDGIPYVLFSTVAIIPWSYMSQAMTQAGESLIQSANMLSKIYFPRVIYPLTPVLARLIDFGISLVLIVLVGVYYQVVPTWKVLLLPFFILMMIAVPAGVGMWLSAMSVRFRDVKHAMPFVVRMLIYSAPIVYSASSIPESYRLVYSLNPIVGVIEGFRACLLGTPLEWRFILPGVITTTAILVGGLLYFRKMEAVFADVI